MSERLEALKGMVLQDPKNSLVRYGLAMEYGRLGQLEQAVSEHRALIEVNPDYCYAYFHGGQALEKLGRLEEARTMYREGILAAHRTGDEHARSELQGALDLLS